MKKSESIINLIKATIAVMQEVKGIDKSMTVGSGSYSYKGVPDQEVKKVIGDSMAKNGLAIFPVGIEETAQVDSWEVAGTRKQSVFTKVKTTYLLTHVSGEFITLMGYGHGVDSQDKSAGKATTYALKYALLYAFLIPTGKIDDSDNTHSEAIPTPQPAKVAMPEPKAPTAEEKNLETQRIVTAAEKLKDCKTEADVKKVWELMPTLHAHKVFIKMVTEAKAKLTVPTN